MLIPQSYGAPRAQCGLRSFVAARGDHAAQVDNAEVEEFAPDALAQFHCRPPGSCQAVAVIALLLHRLGVEASIDRATLPDSIGTG
jgi:hypothetical protein